MNLNTIKNRKIVDKVEGPKPGLSADQFPTEVEDPITGEMKSVKGSDKVKDAADEQLKTAYYNQLKRFVKQLLPYMYPTYEGDMLDAANDIYVRTTEPVTSMEDRKKLKAEDAQNGTTHSEEWYKHKQTKYPKKSKLDWFNPEESSINQFAYTMAKQGIIALMHADPSLKYNTETGKFERVASKKSLDDLTENAEGDMTNSVRKEVEKSAVSQEVVRAEDVIRLFADKSDAEKQKCLDRIRNLVSSRSLPSDTSTELLKAAKVIKESMVQKRDYGVKRASKRKRWEVGTKDDYPFGIEPVWGTTADHAFRVKFKFPTKQEAIEAAKKAEDVMAAKKLKLVGVWGTTLIYEGDDSE